MIGGPPEDQPPMPSPLPMPLPESAPDLPPATAASRRAAAAARRIDRALVASTAPPGEVETIAAELERVADTLEGQAGGSRYDDAPAGPVQVEGPVLERHPFLGHANPVAPPLALSLDGEGVAGTVTFDARHEGVRGCAHGGWVAAMFDQVVGIAAARAAGRAAMTGTLSVRYRAPTPVGVPLRFEARGEVTGERTMRATATAHAGDVLTAEAEAILVIPRDDGLRSRLPSVG